MSSTDWAARTGTVLGAVMIGGAALNAALLATRPAMYQALGDWMNGPEVLQRLWTATMGAHPLVWVPVVGIGYELAVGLLAIARSPRRRLAGLVGIAAFHIGLLVMGLWWWAVPVLAVVVAAIVSTWRGLQVGIAR
ncbi:hypothetical protein [Pseudonocardia xishanensis]|uniref:DoxX-like protein n=1 Tax=Pseudonocardia xishanensis TaxID=630995 RepID=A0ABP8RLN6_9PSEU